MKKATTTMLMAIFLLGMASGVRAEDDMIRRMKELRAKMNMMPDTDEEVEVEAEVQESVDDIDAVEVESPRKDMEYFKEDLDRPTYTTDILDVQDSFVEEVEEIKEAVEDVDINLLDEMTEVEDVDVDVDKLDDLDEQDDMALEEDAIADEEVAESVQGYNYNYDYEYDDQDESSSSILDELAEPVSMESEIGLPDLGVEEEVEIIEEQINAEMEELDDAAGKMTDLVDDMSKNMSGDVDNYGEEFEMPIKSQANVEDFSTALRERTDTIPSELEEIERDIEDISVGLEEIVGKKIRDYKGN